MRLIAGLDALLEYPYGCTEQRIDLASAGLALKPFTPVLAATGFDKRISSDVRNTLQAIAQAIDPNGLVAFWPKAKGNVSLTAWAYSFWNAAKKAGEPVDAALGERLANVLKLSLRSDYGRLIVGDELRERVEALTALADGGQLDSAYVAELARRADSMPNQSVAQMARAVAALPGDDRRVVMSLIDTMWTRVQILSRNGRPYYAGQAAERANPIILPSEARSLAEMTRAVAVATPDDTRLSLLRDGLMRIGGGDGWGSVNATSAAIRALADAWRRPIAALPATLTIGAASQTLTVSGETPVARAVAQWRRPHREPRQCRSRRLGRYKLEARRTGREGASRVERLCRHARILPRARAGRAGKTVAGRERRDHSQGGGRDRGSGRDRQSRRPHPCRDLAAAGGGHGAAQPEPRQFAGRGDAFRRGDAPADMDGLRGRQGLLRL